jgi:hypothetical protein
LSILAQTFAGRPKLEPKSTQLKILETYASGLPKMIDDQFDLDVRSSDHRTSDAKSYESIC